MKKLIIMAISLVAVAGVFITINSGDDYTLAAEMAEQMQSSINELRSELIPGTTLHVQRESFFRHGPASSKIEEISWMMPEHAIFDFYLGPVDESGIFFSEYKSIIRDGNGNIVQTVDTIGDEVVYKDIRSGEVNKRPHVSIGVDEYLQEFEKQSNLLLERGWELVDRHTSSSDGEIIVMERLVEYAVPQAMPGTVLLDESNGVNVPYTLDLSPKEVLNRIEMLSNNPIVHTSQTWIIDASGDRILLRSHEWSFPEIVLP